MDNASTGWRHFAEQQWWNVALIGLCTLMGISLVKAPLLLVAGITITLGTILLTLKFEACVITLLVLRSSLDPFTEMGLTGALAILIDVVTVLYVLGNLIRSRPVHWDWLMVLLAAFVAVQALWPVMMYFGWLGTEFSQSVAGNPTMGSLAVREWIRILSYVMIYALVMQLRGRVAPERMLGLLMFSLVVPILVAYIQLIAPGALPPPLAIQQADRVVGTLSHADTFVNYLLLMIALAWWKWQESKRWLWLALIAVLVVPYVATKTLAGVAMMLVFVGCLLLPRLNFKTIIGSGLAVAIFVAAFASSPLGYERLQALQRTPFFNGNFDVRKALIVSGKEDNSFAWRVAQWTYLVKAWQRSPLLGHGLDSSVGLTPLANGAHNDYVRALAETGVVGLAMFLGLWAAIGTRLVQIYRKAAPGSSQRELCTSLIAVFVAILVGMLSSHFWKTTTFFFYWWTALAVVGWTWPEPKPEKEPLPDRLKHTSPLVTFR